MQGEHGKEVWGYAEDVVAGQVKANKYRIKGCRRFLRMAAEGKYEIRTKAADFVIAFIQGVFVHRQGEDLEGRPLAGTPFLLQPWQKFCIYAMLIFYYPGKKERVVKEALIFIPRKNGKTLLIAGLSFALAVWMRLSGAVVYVVGAALRQAKETFKSWSYCLTRSMYKSKKEAIADGWRIADNSFEHVIANENYGGGNLSLNALPANPDAQDSLNACIIIADELHAYKTPTQYNVLKEATKAYTNKLVAAITTAGDDAMSFCAKHVAYGKGVLDGKFDDDGLFVFICEADEDENGNVDYLDPRVHEEANPSYGITIRPDDIMRDALQAKAEPDKRKDFYAKSLNRFTAQIRAYFSVDQFQRSNREAEELLGISPEWTLEEKLAFLAKLPVRWYGGADLSKWHDLTASAMYTSYNGVDICVPHCWFPIVAATEKADKDNIPLFGWADDGWLDLCNAPTNDHMQVVKWFKGMRARGFKFAEIGHDRKFSAEYLVAMKKAGFKVVDQPQYHWKKSQGFRRIEMKVLNKKFYYLGAEPIEYCAQNVLAFEKEDDTIQYEKIQENRRIDVFDAAVFAAVRLCEDTEHREKSGGWTS